MAAEELHDIVWWTQSLGVEFVRLKIALNENKSLKEIDELLVLMIERAKELKGEIKGARRLIVKLKILRFRLESSIKRGTHNTGWRMNIIDRIERKIKKMHEEAVHAQKQKDYDKIFAYP